jgi:alkylhydroperoxidase/carboxymuconolactone decarboxylase family protein YurZ
VRIAFHPQAAVKQSASGGEVMEAMGMAIYMGAGPLVMYAAHPVEAYGQFKRQEAASGAQAGAQLQSDT